MNYTTFHASRASRSRHEFEWAQKSTIVAVCCRRVTMATITTSPNTSLGTKRDYSSLSKDELIAALVERDAKIAKLSTAAPVVSPEKARDNAERLRTLAYRGIKAQMKWKPSCKRGAARFCYAAMCDEATFRAFMNLEEKDKTKGTNKMDSEGLDELLGKTLSASVRYADLYVRGNVNVSFQKKNNEIKISGGYGL